MSKANLKKDRNGPAKEFHKRIDSQAKLSKNLKDEDKIRKLKVDEPPKVRSAKRKINFEEEPSQAGDGRQLNNNATVAISRDNKQNKQAKVPKVIENELSCSNNAKVITRARSRSHDVNNAEKTIAEGFKVQWTKEFLEKIKRSNERQRNRQAQKGDVNLKVETKLVENQNKQGKQNKKFNVSNTLQEVSSQRRHQAGDGVITTIEVDADTDKIQHEVDQDELLDYEDNLSMEEEDSNEEVEEVNVAGTNMPSVDLSTVLNSQTEDQLMQNPILQKMMTKFFEDKFKDIQGQGSDGKNNGKRGKMVNEGIIKSPSDTTIYAPALNKKLTTPDNILLNRICHRLKRT